MDALISDYRSAPLTEADRAMLDYAVELTRAPGAIDASNVDRLRDAGFDDRAILDICQVTAYYAFANRVADGLGIELEPYWEEVEECWRGRAINDRYPLRPL